MVIETRDERPGSSAESIVSTSTLAYWVKLAKEGRLSKAEGKDRSPGRRWKLPVSAGKRRVENGA